MRACVDICAVILACASAIYLQDLSRFGRGQLILMTSANVSIVSLKDLVLMNFVLKVFSNPTITLTYLTYSVSSSILSCIHFGIIRTLGTNAVLWE